MTRTFTADRRRLAGLRIAAQRIGARVDPAASADPADTVRHLLAIQAQDFAGAKWGVGCRTRGSTDASVEAALASGSIVRSWPMRGTLHLVPPEDLGWMLSLTAPRMIQSTATRKKQLELTDSDLARAGEVAAGELSGGRALTRNDLLARFEEAGVSVAGQRGYHMLSHLGVTQQIVFGPVDGTQQSFVLLDEWVERPRRLEREEALGEFVVRYFTGHGPATVRDFAWWSSLTLADARAGLAVGRARLEQLDIDGEPYFMAPGLEPASDAVHALTGFDEYLLGYRVRDAALAPEHSTRVVPGKNGMFLSTIVVNGEVVGTWRRTLARSGVSVELDPFEQLSAATRAALDRTMKDYAAFLERPLVT
jgi:hypothetical protein